MESLMEGPDLAGAIDVAGCLQAMCEAHTSLDKKHNSEKPPEDTKKSDADSKINWNLSADKLIISSRWYVEACKCGVVWCDSEPSAFGYECDVQDPKKHVSGGKVSEYIENEKIIIVVSSEVDEKLICAELFLLTGKRIFIAKKLLDFAYARFEQDTCPVIRQLQGVKDAIIKK